MPLGCGNSLPLQVGGSPTRFEKSYAVLQRMVGRNGYSANDDEIEALWRQAKADAMACLETFDERAAMQATPLTATDHLPLYEAEQGLLTDKLTAQQQRREAVVTRYRATPEPWTSGLLSALRQIEPSVEIITRPWANTTTTQAGRWYAPFEPTPSNDYGGGRAGTSFPNFSDAHEVLVHFPIANGFVPSNDQLRRVSQMRDTLYEVCPGWVNYRIIHSIGFILDESRLDATAFGV